jgi:hypothetical protein
MRNLRHPFLPLTEEECLNRDPCPFDAENDRDSDNLCGNDDPCPYDPEHDADKDGICGDVDKCPYDPANDRDGDQLCLRNDKCPLDEENDADSEGICGDVDLCRYDAENDVDRDGLCETECGIHSSQYQHHVECAVIKNSDSLCLASFEKAKKWASPCCTIEKSVGFGWSCAPQLFVEHNGLKQFAHCKAYNLTGCGDKYEVDHCPYDRKNDIDKDGICGDVDSCPVDAENDADSDRMWQPRRMCIRRGK